jgi:L-serine kinase (ADP)
VNIELVDPKQLRHIEGFSARRVQWLQDKIVAQGRWIKPIAIDDAHHLVLDGQHRMEVALKLGLKRIPAVKFSYAAVEIWSLRPKYSFVWQDVVARALDANIYPYKTVKHRFPEELPACDFALEELGS